MSTIADRITLLHNQKEAENLDRIKREYPGIDRILTSEKIAAYDRGEYDDLDEALRRISGTNSPNQDKGVNLEHDRVDTIVMWWSIYNCRDVDINTTLYLRSLHLREYEAEIISRYKAGLL